MNNEVIIYQVCETNTETQNVKTLKLVTGNGSVPNYIPGQFITVYHPSSNIVEGKAYSISSSPHEQTLNITVKSIGEFSSMLFCKRPGDTIKASLPYGYFYTESDTTPLVMIAGGIGIAPLYSMIIHNLKNFPKRNLTLLYSNKTHEDVVFREELNKLHLSKECNYSHKLFLTRQSNHIGNFTFRRLNQKDFSTDRYPTDTEYLVCGSINFVRSIWTKLRDLNINESRIYTESFY